MAKKIKRDKRILPPLKVTFHWDKPKTEAEVMDVKRRIDAMYDILIEATIEQMEKDGVFNNPNNPASPFYQDMYAAYLRHHGTPNSTFPDA